MVWLLLFTLPTLWFVGDACYALAVAIQKRAFEKRAGRSPTGLLPNAESITAGDGDVAVLFIPGFADTPAVFRRMVATLTREQAVHCHVLRVPGMGDLRGCNLRDWEVAITEAYSKLRMGHSRTYLCGHSLGGGLVLRLAPKLQPDGLILLAPLIDVSRTRMPLRLSARRVWRALSPWLFFTRTFKSIFPAYRVAADDPTYTYQADQFVSCEAYQALFSLVESLNQFSETNQPLRDIPTLLVTASDDQVVDNQAINHFVERYQLCPTRVELPCGHSIPLESCWRQLIPPMISLLFPQQG